MRDFDYLEYSHNPINSAIYQNKTVLFLLLRKISTFLFKRFVTTFTMSTELRLLVIIYILLGLYNHYLTRT